jgi:hypothetical protein
MAMRRAHEAHLSGAPVPDWAPEGSDLAFGFQFAEAMLVVLALLSDETGQKVARDRPRTYGPAGPPPEVRRAFREQLDALRPWVKQRLAEIRGEEARSR